MLGDQLPTGFPGLNDKYFICQKFAQDESYLGSSLKRSYYGTVYDTKQRIPVMSFGRFRNLSDSAEPMLEYMIEKGIYLNY